MRTCLFQLCSFPTNYAYFQLCLFQLCSFPTNYAYFQLYSFPTAMLISNYAHFQLSSFQLRQFPTMPISKHAHSQLHSFPTMLCLLSKACDIPSTLTHHGTEQICYSRIRMDELPCHPVGQSLGVAFKLPWSCLLFFHLCIF